MDIKKIAKYATNVLAVINAIIIGIDPIWNIPYAYQISQTSLVLMGVIGTYLLGTKVQATYVAGKEK